MPTFQKHLKESGKAVDRLLGASVISTSSKFTEEEPSTIEDVENRRKEVETLTFASSSSGDSVPQPPKSKRLYSTIGKVILDMKEKPKYQNTVS